MKKIILFVLGLFAYILSAQEIVVSGKVVDENNFPYVAVHVTFDGVGENVNIFKDVMSDENGEFSIRLEKGKYTMIIQPITGNIIEREENFLKDTHLGVIRISNTINLGKTVIQGEKPLYRLELDKRVYDMSRDATVKGSSLSDALNNVPSVQVDGEGTLSLRGNENVKVLINGKPSSMTGISNVGDALRNIQADQVERVEVITNPSSRYDAEGSGGIINIILKKGTRLGFNGSISTNAGYPWSAGVNADLNYRTQKWNFFISPFVSYRESNGERDFKNLRYYTNAPDTITYQDGEPLRTMRNVGGNIGLEHFLTDKSTLSASAYIRKGNDDSDNKTHSRILANQNLVQQSIRSLFEKENEYNVEGNIGFRHEFNPDGHQLDLQVSTSWAEEEENGDINDIITYGNGINQFEKNYTRETQRRWLMQGDYVLPFQDNARLELGSKLEMQDTQTDFSVSNLKNNLWELNLGLSDLLSYSQNIFAAYTQYGNRFGKFSFLAGIRVENSDITIDSKSAGQGIENPQNKNYTDWFPTATINYYVDDAEKNQIQLSYSKRIRRPWSRWLSPFKSRSDDTNVFQGNPNLDPVKSQNLELSYITQINKTTLTPSVYYQKSTDDMTVLRRLTTLDGESVFLSMPINAGDEQRYGAELVASTSFANWWRVFGNLNLFGYKSTGSYKDQTHNKTYDLSGDGFSWFGRISNNITLPKQINMQINAFYSAGQDNAQSKRDPIWAVDFALTKDVLNGDGTLSFNVRDAFNTRNRKIHNFGESYDSYIDMRWRPRTFTLNFTYRINQKKQRERGNKRVMDDGDEGMEM